MARQRLCPAFRRLRFSQEACSLLPHSSFCKPCKNCIAEFAESGEEPSPARLTVAGKVDGTKQDT